MDKPSWYPRGTLREPFEPVEIDTLSMVFSASVVELMPPVEAIPEEFHNMIAGIVKEAKKGTPDYWIDFQSTWFIKGVDTEGIKAKDGIDKKAALRHLGTIQASYEPKHEYKVAAVAYLASLWLKSWK